MKIRQSQPTPAPAPAPLSTSYSLAGFSLEHSVDDLTLPNPSEIESLTRRASAGQHRLVKKRLADCLENNYILFLGQPRSLKWLAAHCAFDELSENARSFPWLNLARTCRQFISDPDLMDPIQAVSYAGNIYYAENYYLQNDTPEDQPMFASQLGLKSQFLTQGTNLFSSREGARPDDYRNWTEGFDAAIFRKSARLHTPLLVQYRLAETEETYEKFYAVGPVYGRSRQAFHELQNIAKQMLVSELPSAEFSRIAERFFKGKPMDEKFEEWNRTATHSGDDRREGFIIDHKHKSAWKQFVDEVAEAAVQESVPLFKNTAHKAFGLFIQDVTLSNEMNKAMKYMDLSEREKVKEENAAIKPKTSWWYPVKVLPSQAHVKATEILATGGPITKEDLELISQLKRDDEKDQVYTQISLDGSRGVRITDITGLTDDIDHIFDAGDPLVDPEDDDANSKTADEQLIDELETHLSKNQPGKKSKPKSRKRKPKAKGSATKATSQAESSKEAKSSEEVKSSCEAEDPIQSKGETSSSAASQKPLEPSAVKKPEISKGGIATPSKPATTSDIKKKPHQKTNPVDKPTVSSKSATDIKKKPQVTTNPAVSTKSVADSDMKKSQGKTNVVDKSALSAKSVITLSDYEDAPFAAKSSTNKTEGWQTVKKPSKPKPTGVTAVRASSEGMPDGKGGIPGANYLPQTGARSSIGSGQQINRQSGTRPANQNLGFKPAARSATTSEHHKVNPTTSTPTEAGASSKSAVQTPVFDDDELYEAEYPPLEGDVVKQTTTAQTRKVTPVVPKKAVKPSVTAKGKGAKNVSANAGGGEKVMRESDSDLKLASKKNDDALDNSEETSTRKDGSNMTSTPKKATKEVIDDVLKVPTPKRDRVANLASKVASKKSVDLDRGTQGGSTNGITNFKVDVPQSIEKVQVPLATSVMAEVSTVTDISSSEHEDLSQLQESFSDGPTSEEPSHLDEDYPVTPQHPMPSRQVHVKDVSVTPVNVEEPDSTPMKNVEDSLSWAGDSLTLPLNFAGRPRGISLPGDVLHNPDIFTTSPPSILQRARGLSLRSQISTEDDDGSDGNPSTVPEEDSTSRADEPVEHSEPSEVEPSTEATTTSEKLIVVTVHPDNTFTVISPVAGSSSRASTSAAPAMKYGLPAVVRTAANSAWMDAPLTQADYGVPRDHPHHPLNSSTGYMPGFPTAGNGGAGPSSASSVLPGGPYSCNQCNINIVPTLENPMVFCPGCGPDSGTSYCSVECLLVDSYDHAEECWNMPAVSRISYVPFPPGSPYVYEHNPVAPETMKDSSREKFRQRLFLMYARYGPWRNLAKAWCRKHVEWPVSTPQYPVTPELRQQHHQWLIEWETSKRTGSYFIFWSGTFIHQSRGNPKADVIYTVALEQSDPQRQYLSRILYALMVREEGIRKPMVTFAYRMIRNILTTPALYNNGMGAWEDAGLVLAEFERQWQIEFNFNHSMDRCSHVPFDFNREIGTCYAELLSIESSFSTLQYWKRDVA